MIALAIGAGAAATTLFATLPHLGTRSRAWMLAPHLGQPPDGGRPATDVGALREALFAAGTASARLADRITGVVEPLAARLDRVQATDDVASFRFRQGAGAISAAVLSAGITLAVGAPSPLTGLLLVGLPVLAILVPELELSARGRRWSWASRNELPVVGEELVALLHAGRSPSTALERIADPSGSPLRRDIARVVEHLGRGGGLDEALGAWVDRSDVESVDRLCRALSLHHRTPDLASLVSREVDAARDALHRDLLAQIDRKSQQVWIPVTVAALVPGAIFLLVPFFDALRLFGAT